MTETTPNFEFTSYFSEPNNKLHKQYLALRRFFLDGHTAAQIAVEFDYSIGTVYALVRDFKTNIRNGSEDPFFKVNKTGRKPIDQQGVIEELVIDYRKKYYSVPDIKIALNGLGVNISEGLIYEIITKAGFARLPRRGKDAKNEILSSTPSKIKAPVSEKLNLVDETFSTQLAGLLCVLPYIVHYGIHDVIIGSSYPQTSDINRLSSILSFIALKLSNVKRYSADDSWCMDRGMGLFAGLNVLPKAAWFSSYSSTITRDTNLAFLKSLQTIWLDNNLLSDTMNLDFTTIPYWGDDEPFEKNWSGKRGKALAAICAVIAQDPHQGILCYGDTTIRHENQSDTILEFLDFYHADKNIDKPLKYLVFDSKFTTYQNLDILNQRAIKFVTIRRRGTRLVDRIRQIPDEQWNKVKIKKANSKSRTVTAYEEQTKIKSYNGIIRQIFIKDNGKIKPAIIITNELDMPIADLLQKYAARWLVEKELAEHMDFFHLNRNSSGIVIKVDFDLTISLLTHNIYRLFALDYIGYTQCDAETIFDKFISGQGNVEIQSRTILVKLKKKRTLPLILEQMEQFKEFSFPWLNGFKISFVPDTTT